MPQARRTGARPATRRRSAGREPSDRASVAAGPDGTIGTEGDVLVDDIADLVEPPDPFDSSDSFDPFDPSDHSDVSEPFEQEEVAGKARGADQGGRRNGPASAGAGRAPDRAAAPGRAGSGSTSGGSAASRDGGASADGADDRAARARSDAQAVVRRAAARRQRRSGEGAAPAPAASGGQPDVTAADGAADGDGVGDAQEGPPTRGLLLVGPGSTFGAQLLHRFAREGFVTAVVSRSADTVARVRGELDADGVPLLGAVADVTDPPSFVAAVSGLAAAMGGLTVMVYNAKLSIRSSALTVSAQTLNQTLAVNVTGALTAVQAALPQLADRPGATVLLTTAGTRTEPPPGRFALAVGKAGLAALGTSLVGPLRAQGVRLRTVVLDGLVGADGPLLPASVADHFWHAYAAPRGATFRLTPDGGEAPADQLPFPVPS